MTVGSFFTGAGSVLTITTGALALLTAALDEKNLALCSDFPRLIRFMARRTAKHRQYICISNTQKVYGEAEQYTAKDFV
tara:strand:+ start:449 stop:685 length:237 start_codon:yes stop_codon:yes gene_type:complete